jgi:hypothetical protein
MTVISVFAGQGASQRHPLDLNHCIQKARLAPKGKKVQVRMHAVRHSKVCSNGAGRSADATAFLFCSKDKNVSTARNAAQADDDKESVEVAGVRLPSFEYTNIGLMLPAAIAAHNGLLTPAGVACACLPIMAPFSIPQVSPDSWMANKRALAFHRCCTIGVYTQGALALFKFAGGDLVGGTYLALQAAMGCYSVTPEGLRLMPTFMVVAGFNGILGLIQIFQNFQGVPFQLIPLTAYLPSALSILTCYWGWQFCREVRAIGAGLPGDGPQDTCWVKLMGGDFWPLSLISVSSRSEDRVDGRDSVAGGGTGTGNLTNRFSAFGGSGHRLGEQ